MLLRRRLLYNKLQNGGGNMKPLPNQIFYTTNDGNTISVKSYWTQPILNYYDKEKDMGVMVFENPLTEIPGVSGEPFLHEQKNLLTLRLPVTITKFGRGALWNCSNLNYINLIDLVNLDTLEREWLAGTNITQIDLRNSNITYLKDTSFASDTWDINIDYLLLPQTIQTIDSNTFYNSRQKTRINTLMMPTLRGNINDIANVVLENLIINKFDGLGDLHSFNTGCKIWVPDEFYNGYVEKYSGNDNILSRLRKYSEGVPQFPYN